MSRRIPEDTTPANPVSIPDEAVRAKLLELLGLEKVPECLDCTVESSEACEEGLVLVRLHFANVLGEAVPAILLIPSSVGAGGVSGVVCLPGTSGDAERLTHEQFGRRGADAGPLLGWARELARRGFATLSVTVKGTERRRERVGDWEHEAKWLAPYGRSQMGVIVDEALRAARILEAWEGVDAERIGLAGMSLGGNAAWYGMACAGWISCAVAVCGGVGSLRAVIQRGDPERHSSYFFIPHMLRFFDHPRVVRTCIAPRPFMMVAPTMDEDMPSAGVDELMREVGPAYEEAGAGERFRVYRPETNHQFRVEFFEWMVEWFTVHLMP